MDGDIDILVKFEGKTENSKYAISFTTTVNNNPQVNIELLKLLFLH